MALDLRDCTLFGPALPEPFVKFHLETQLLSAKLLAKNTGAEGKSLQNSWEIYRRKLLELSDSAGALSVKHHVLDPLVERLRYDKIERAEDVETREGVEDGGWVFGTNDGRSLLRTWSCASDTDLDAPARRGHAYRFSPSRVAQRVLLTKGERVGLLTDGQELRLLICDPARPESHVSIPLDRRGGWRNGREVPDSYRLLLALASPAGVPEVPKLTEEARLTQTTVTRKLRDQARRAIEGFVQELLDHAGNRERLASESDKAALARELWKEGLILVYRLLFILKLESSSDPARAFSFASTDFWRDSLSPNRILADHARKVLDDGLDTGRLLESSLRSLFRVFSEGLTTSGIHVAPLGGMLFGDGTTPTIDRLYWGEQAVAKLIDRLLWTPGSGGEDRERVHYGTLDVEDLGRVYEALLELEPGIATETMCRLRRAKLEVVLPRASGDRFRDEQAASTGDQDDDRVEEDEEERPRQGARTRVQWIEEIPAGRFYLRVGLGRKSTGSYYTPHAFVRFLVQETLRPQIEERSPHHDPKPSAILALKVVDPAMGSGHFLVEACRYLGDSLYEACRLCDELAVVAEEQAAKEPAKRDEHVARARELHARVEQLPDPADELVAYLPSHAVEGSESGHSQRRAEALCRRLVAVHCLYGVDKNPLAVELAKLAIWLESYAEGMPLTFMDHRLVCGDSLTGPFFEHLAVWPVSGERMDDLFVQGLEKRLKEALTDALKHVRDLEATIGKDVADLELKRAAKRRLDDALAPFRKLAAVWTGAVMSGGRLDDRQYERQAKAISDDSDDTTTDERINRLIAIGRHAWAYDLGFPEVFHPDGQLDRSSGFNAVLGNPPWDAIQFKSKEFLAGFDLDVFEAPTKHERATVEARLMSRRDVSTLFQDEAEVFERLKRANGSLYQFQKVFIDGDLAGRQLDAFRVFMERFAQLAGKGGAVGAVVPSAFHANAGATGVRQLYLERMELGCCYSFENRRKLFDIHRSFKFAVVVARKQEQGTREFACAFYLHELDWLFSGTEPLRYTIDFVRKTGGEYLNFAEFRSPNDVILARQIYESAESFGGYCDRSHVAWRTTELHTSHDSALFQPIVPALEIPNSERESDGFAALLSRGLSPITEGKTFHQYRRSWGEPPRYMIAHTDLREKLDFLRDSRFFRLAFRQVASSTNERTVIFAALPPGTIAVETAIIERQPQSRPYASALLALAVANSFSFDWITRQRCAAHVNLFLLNQSPFPNGVGSAALVHGALRLSATDRCYEPLWRDQLSSCWREETPAWTWPAIGLENNHWRIRSTLDAVIANWCRLSRDQYACLLASFSHRTAPTAPTLCLSAFDEVQRLGLEAFCKKHDPYWDIPLNQSLPEPVIDFPELHTADSGQLTHERSGQLSFVAPDFGPLYRQAARDVAGAATSASAPASRSTAAQSNEDAFRRISSLLDDRSVITSADAQVLTGLDAASVRRHLQRLVNEGRAVVEGQRRGTKYRRVQGSA